MALTSSQAAAVAHVRVGDHGPPLPDGPEVTVSFHPDLRTATPAGGDVLGAMAGTGRYLPQWVTRISNGAVSHKTGGERWLRESAMFGGAYNTTEPHERPVYGALNLLGLAGGAATRFGSCYLRLRAEVLDRTTFCYPDSMFPPVRQGVRDSFALATPLLTAIRAHAADPDDDFIDYVEAQIHGGVVLAADAAALVLDPSFRGTAVECRALDLGCPVEWHPGFRAELGVLAEHAGYRGDRFVALAAEVCGQARVLTPELIARARGAHSRYDLERVWHLLAWFGRPPEDRATLRQAAR